MTDTPFLRASLRRRAVLAVGTAGGLAGPAALGRAASSFPDRPVRIIVPNPPGGSSDTLSRLVAREMQPRFPQPLVVENRSGSNGITALDHAAKSRPAGYAMVVATVTQLISNPFVYRSIPYDLDQDFTPVGLVWEYYNVIAVPAASVVARTLPAFVAWARQQHGGVSYGSNGIATSPHLLGATFAQAAGFEALHVPYRGTAETVPAMLRGDVQFTISDVASLSPFFARGDLVPLAVTGRVRWGSLPDVPTVRELGFPQLEATVWTGVVIASGAQPGVLDALATALARTLEEPALKERIRGAGANPLTPDPAAMRRLIIEERPRWGEMVRVSGARLD